MDEESEGPRSIENRIGHWDRTYQHDGLPTYPSQFAVFVCDYLKPGQNVVEFGCGTGRDANFFARQGYRVFGFDASEAAIARCRAAAPSECAAAPVFSQLSISDGWTGDDLSRESRGISSALDLSTDILVYARFFLHAITADEQAQFLELLRLIGDPGIMCAFEFRTLRDAGQSKIAQPHYRRFVDPLHLLEELEARGFKLEYFVEGFGMAKYKTEDAHVARVVSYKPAKDAPGS